MPITFLKLNLKLQFITPSFYPLVHSYLTFNILSFKVSGLRIFSCVYGMWLYQLSISTLSKEISRSRNCSQILMPRNTFHLEPLVATIIIITEELWIRQHKVLTLWTRGKYKWREKHPINKNKIIYLHLKLQSFQTQI